MVWSFNIGNWTLTFDYIWFCQHIILFMIYAFGGWLIEEVDVSIKEKKLVNRGFLMGPLCPIYGFGGILITLVLTKFYNSPVTLFVMAMFLCAFLEYFTSWYMEKKYHARWWDYSDNQLNLNGRISMRTLIPFGCMGLLIIYLVNPFFDKQFAKLSETTTIIVANVLFWLTIVDAIISTIIVTKMTKTADKVEDNNPRDDTNEIKKKTYEEFRKHFTTRRIVNAFPDFEPVKLKIREMAEEANLRGKQFAKNVETKTKYVAKNVETKTKDVAKKAKDVAAKGKEKAAEAVKNAAKKRSTKENKDNL